MAYRIVGGRVVDVGSVPSGSSGTRPPGAYMGPGGPINTGGGGGLAKPVANPGTNGSNMRYYVGPGSGLQRLPNGDWTDGQYTYDPNGLSRDRPDAPVAGLPPANESESYDVYTGQVKGGGGGGAGGGLVGAGGGPYVEQMRAMLKAQGTADLANTQAAIRKALIGFGIVPEGYEDKLGVLDDVTKSLIAKNQESGISYYARLLDQKKDNLRSLLGRLSNTGMRRSGTRGRKLRQGQLEFDRLFQDSLSELLGQVGNLYQGYAGNEQNRQMQLLQAMQSGNVWSGAGSTVQAPAPSGGGFTRYDPGSQTTYSYANILAPGSGPSSSLANRLGGISGATNTFNLGGNLAF